MTIYLYNNEYGIFTDIDGNYIKDEAAVSMADTYIVRTLLENLRKQIDPAFTYSITTTMTYNVLFEFAQVRVRFELFFENDGVAESCYADVLMNVKDMRAMASLSADITASAIAYQLRDQIAIIRQTEIAKGENKNE